MKKIIALSAVTFYVMFVAYYQIYKKDDGIKNQGYDQKFFFDFKTLNGIRVQTPEQNISLELRDDLWWVTSPIEFPADQDFIEKNLRIINQTVVENIFQKSERDYYGFNPGQGQIEFLHGDGETRRFVLGAEEAPQNKLYLLNSKNNEVLVVHNLWGQFFYHSKDMFFSKGLPLNGLQVKSVDFYVDQQKVWQIKASSSNYVDMIFESQKKLLSKAKLMWFFKGISELTLQDLSPLNGVSINGRHTLSVETENGSTDYIFNEELREVYIPKNNLRARYEPSDLSGLINELKKVVQGD